MDTIHAYILTEEELDRMALEAVEAYGKFCVPVIPLDEINRYNAATAQRLADRGILILKEQIGSMLSYVLAE